MGRKKNRAVVVQEETYKIFCFYCDREFIDEKVLISHQQAKHFKCHICHKKLYSAGGLYIHVSQVHKDSISEVPNALPGRESLEYKVYGMSGIPYELLEDGDDEAKKRAKVEQGYQQQNVPGLPVGIPPPRMYPPHMFPPGQFPPTGPPSMGYMPPQGMPPPPMPGMLPRHPMPNMSPHSTVPPGQFFQPPMVTGMPPQFVPPAQNMQQQPQQQQQSSTNPEIVGSVTYANQTQVIPPVEKSVEVSAPQSTSVAPTPTPSDFSMIYNDNSLSMEEKRAQLQRYRYVV